MADDQKPVVWLEVVGAWQGSGKASEMGPPPKIPSASVQSYRKRTRRKKSA